MLGRPWAPVVAAGLVVLSVLLVVVGIVVLWSVLGGRGPAGGLAGAPGTEPEIRVRIHKGAAAMTVEAPGLIEVEDGHGSSREMTGPLTIACGPAGISISDASGDRVEPGITRGARIASGSGRVESGGFRGLRVDGVDYPGVLILDPRSEDGPEAFDAVLEMPIEDYLPGVVVREMLARWPKAAYEVQAVCARTYALHDRERARKAGRPFDVESSTLDQVYGGISTNPVVVGAVAATRGMVVTWDGGLLRTYYSSTCGGRPSSAAEVWPTSAGFEFNRAEPLQAQERETFCAGSSSYTWEAQRNAEDVGRRIRAWGKHAGQGVKALGSIRTIEVAEINACKRPMNYRLTDDRGQSFRVTAEELRVASNWTVPGLAALTRAQRIGSSDVEAEVRGDQVQFRGRGLGHGVGMCQWCAKGMAERGWDSRSMIARFYPGAGVERSYE